MMLLTGKSNKSRCLLLAARRWKSTAAATKAPATTAVAPSEEQHPTLVKVPKLPLIGCGWQSYSQLPVPHNQDRVFEFWPAMRAKFGSFYEFGMPGIGADLTGTCYVIQDPKEMASVLRQEGDYPRGSVELSWALVKFFKDRNYPISGLLSHGPEWQRMRRFVQSDLLSPAAAARYVPAILEAAQVASRGAQHHSDNLNEYLNLASFDMFCNIMLGYVPKVSDSTACSDPQDVEFCRNVAMALRASSYFMTSPKEGILNMGLGIKTKKYKEYEEFYDKAYDYAMEQVRDLYQRKLDGALSDKENDSYTSMAYERQASEQTTTKEEAKVRVEEVESIIGGLMAAGVDTTGGMLSFKLLHLASSPQVQDKLYHELQPTLLNGKLTRESLAVPYLTQILRESHRIGNNIQTMPIRALQLDREIHGHALPKGSVILLDTYSTGQQQEHFEDPIGDFVPERFSRDAIEARKGTRHQVVDHSFFSGPFSQGARKCPGSRVAKLEAHALVAQWVLDWKMELPSGMHFLDVPYDLVTVTTSILPAIQFTPRQK